MNRAMNFIGHVWGHQGFQKYFRNTGWMFLGHFFYLLSSFFSVLFVARFLGPTSYGELSYAVSFSSLFSFIIGFGSIKILYRELVQHPDKKDKLLGTVWVINLFSAFFTQIILIIAALSFSPKDVSFWAIIILSFSFYFNTFNIIGTEFNSLIKTKWATMSFIFSHVFVAILKIILVTNGKGVLYIAGVIVVESIITMLLLVFIRYKKIGTILNWKFDKEISKQILKDSWPLIISSAFAIIYAKIDQVMIKQFIDSTAVGFYNAAVKLSEFMELCANPFYQLSFSSNNKC
jgi:O-antigen/teichoic acid export membrane protein